MPANVDNDLVNQALLEEWGEPVTLFPDTTEEQSVIGIVASSADVEARDPGNVSKIFFMLSTLTRLPEIDECVLLGTSKFVIERVFSVQQGGIEVLVRGGQKAYL